MAQEQRSVVDFDEVRMEGTGTIFIRQGERESLTIEATEHLLSKIKSDVNAGRLELGFRHWYDYLVEIGHSEITYHLTVLRLRGVTLSGSGKIHAGPLQTDRMQFRVSGSGDLECESIQTRDLDVQVSGSSKVKLRGSAEQLQVEISGTGDLQAFDLLAKEVRLRISGSGKMEVNAEQRLDARISGSGDIRYTGSPDVSQSISGAGSVRRV